MYFNGPCINCGEFPIYDEGALESSTVSPCSQFAETNCIKYTGLVYACANINTGMTLDEVINKLATTYQNCTPCQITHQFNQNCEKGWELIFDNDDYIATWYYKDAVSNTYLPIDPNLISTVDKLGVNNKLKTIQLLPAEKFIKLTGGDFRIEITKSGCTTITIDWQTDVPCQLLQPCTTTNAKFIKKAGTNNILKITQKRIPNVSNLYLEWLSCKYLPNIETNDCQAEQKGIAFRNKYDDYLKDSNEIFTTEQYGFGTLSPNNQPLDYAPLAYVDDWVNGGPESQVDPNSTYTDYPVFAGCGCEIQTSLGMTIFEVTYLDPVPTFSALSNVTGFLGQFVKVLDDTVVDYYTWNPNTASWIPEETFTNLNGNTFHDPNNPTVPFSDISDCATLMRQKRDLNLKNLNEMIQSWNSFTYASLTIPYYFAKRQLTSPMIPVYGVGAIPGSKPFCTCSCSQIV